MVGRQLLKALSQAALQIVGFANLDFEDLSDPYRIEWVLERHNFTESSVHVHSTIVRQEPDGEGNCREESMMNIIW